MKTYFRKGRRRIAVAAVVLAATGIVINCGKDSDDDSATESDVAQLALSYPLGLSLAIAPQTNTSTALATLVEQEPSAKVKNEEAGKMIRGESDSCMPAAVTKADGNQTAESCYEFDSEMIYIKDGSSGAFVNGTKTGISTSVTNEACMVTYTRKQVKQITGMVDRTLGMVQMMICQAKKAGQGAPSGDGGSIDFKEIMSAAITAAGKDPTHLPFKEAQMTRTGDNYVTVIEMQRSSAPNTPPAASDPIEKITLTHKPTNADNTEFEGSVVIRRDKDFDGSSNMERILTITYVRSGGRVKYRLLTARMNKEISADAVVDGKLNLNAGTNSAGAYVSPTTGAAYPSQNDGANAIMAVSFNMDPDTNAGNFSYWQNPGGSYDEQTRGFVFKMDANATSGLLSGCSASGAYSGGSIRKAMAQDSTIAPDRSYHPFACGSTNCTSKASPANDSDGYYYPAVRGGVTLKTYIPATNNSSSNNQDWTWEQNSNFVARQCFVQGSDGVYTVDGSAMTNEGTAGFELLASTSTALPPPPDLTGVK